MRLQYFGHPTHAITASAVIALYERVRGQNNTRERR